MSLEVCKSSDPLLETAKITEDFVAHFIKEEQIIKEEPYFKDDSRMTIKEEPIVNNDESFLQTEHPDVSYNPDSLVLLEPKIEQNESEMTRKSEGHSGHTLCLSLKITGNTQYKSIENHCYFCQTDFINSTDFYDHMFNLHHLDELCFTRKKWSCRACKDNFLKQNCLHDSMEQLQHHINFCNDKNYNNGPFREAHRFAFICNLCKCGFGGLGGAHTLSSHFTSIHDNPHAVKVKVDPLLRNKRKLPHETLAEKKTRKLEMLASSNILIETNTKKLKKVKNAKITAFKCNVCHNSFTALEELVKHSKICKGENPFCNSGEKRFHCYDCFKVFPTRGSLFVHKSNQKGLCKGKS